MCMPVLGYVFKECDFIGRKLVNGGKIMIFFWVDKKYQVLRAMHGESKSVAYALLGC